MTSPIFIDANVPIYAGGAPHPLQGPCKGVLRITALDPRGFWTNAEVFQELLHRYLAVNRWLQGRGIFEDFARLMRGRIEPITASDAELAAEFADRGLGLSARDLIHIAVMQRAGADTLISADGGFDRAPGIHRLDPADVAVWRGQIRR